MRAIVNLAGYYIRDPRRLAAHLADGAAILRRDGFGAFLREFEQVRRTSSDQARHRVAHREPLRRLAGMDRAARRNADAILAAIRKVLPIPGAIEIVGDRVDRLRALEYHLLDTLGLFDPDFYRRRTGVRADDFTLTRHYLEIGRAAGLKPNPHFDPIAYVSAYPDVPAFGMDPLIHFGLFGWREGRSTGLSADALAWLRAWPGDETEPAPLGRFVSRARKARAVGRRDGAGRMRPVRGTILVVSHDAELGGAPMVARMMARWLSERTRFDVRIVLMKRGPFVREFAAIAEVFDWSARVDRVGEAAAAEELAAWAGDDLRVVLLNSAAGGGFLRAWRGAAPVVAFLHEQGAALTRYAEEIRLILERSARIVAGGPGVYEGLVGLGAPQERLLTLPSFIEGGTPVPAEAKAAAKAREGVAPGRLLICACAVAHRRKRPDLFVDVAEAALAAGLDAEFLWIGGGPDQAEHSAEIARRGLADRVRFTGYAADAADRLAAADLFLLTSEEDPFPLVALYAARAQAPVICFEGSGGIPGFVAGGAGLAVPHCDADAMARAVLDYAADPERRAREGARGAELVAEDYTVDVAGPKMLAILRDAAGLAPEVSVVVPNYQCAPFLAQRLDSIAAQTLQDFEVVLLDDASTDGGAETLRAWAERRPGARVVVNERNTGSPFAQWLRGMRMARAPLVWIAEADDWCAPELLEALVPAFDDRNVFLAHAKSVPVDVDGATLGDYAPLYLDRIAPGRWSRSYVATDHEEVSAAMGIASAIPNASAVIVRAFEPEPELARDLSSCRLCGDWLFYLRALRGGSIAYEAAALNFHRRHEGTVTRRLEGTTRYFAELASVHAFVDRTWRLDADALAARARFAADEAARFGGIPPSKPSAAPRKALPTVAVIAPDLGPGGGQMFAIRLANALGRRGARPLLIDAARFPEHARVVAKIDPRVAVLRLADPSELPDALSRHDVDLVHSTIWWGDRLAQDGIAAGELSLPWTVTMHGCHETLLSAPGVDPGFARRMPQMLERVDAWVHTADKNLAVFDRFGAPPRLLKIPNGVAVEPEAPLDRAELGLRPEALVLCLASRAIPEKGWFDAVDVVADLNAGGTPVDLMLIGEGLAADELRARAPDHVQLFGQVSNLQAYLAAADVGVLPSRFVGESLPLVILETMACGRPTVATDRGEIPAILGEGGDAGGFVVPLVDGKVDRPAFADAVRRLVDPELRARMGAAAAARFAERYTIERMTDAYLALYRDLIEGRAPDQDEKAPVLAATAAG